MDKSYSIDFSRYYRYDELVSHLRNLEALYPELMSMRSIGKSHEGRDLWIVTITNLSTGAAENKPAFYVEGNMHAGEVTGSATCLYTIWYLLTKFGEDAEVTNLLNSRAFYIHPRVAPDGAELYLTTPYTVRSSTRYYPFKEKQDGLNPEDLNGDGWITSMRVKDDNGEFKISTKDSRVMAKREPSETGGEYYKVYTEGMVKNWKGGPIKMAPPAQGIDFNRNYPANWQPETVQSGSGPYPLSEPETRHVAEFLLETKNITGVMSYHTFTGILLRPPCTRRDEKVPPKDLEMFNTLSKIGADLTGYIPMTVMDLNENRPSCGNLKDFIYEFQGIYIFTAELWDVAARAGAKNIATDFLRRKTEDDEVAVLRWMDENGVDGFVPWTPFEHPQLGPVEIGGFKFKFLIQNPPPKFLEAECHKNCVFTLKQAGMSPLLHIRSLASRPLGGGLFKITAEVENEGFMPTNISEQAKIMRVARPVVASISCSDGVEVVSGEARVSLDHIDGRAAAMSSLFGSVASPSMKSVSWVVRCGSGAGRVTVKAESPKAGRAEATVEVGA